MKSRIGSILLLMSILGTPVISKDVEVAYSDLAAVNRATLFERVFGKSAQSAPQYLEVQFSFDYQAPILLGVQYSFVSRELLLPLESLRFYFEQTLKPEFFQEILSGQDGAGYLSRAFLESKGFTFQFDTQKLFLNLNSPYEHRKLVLVDFVPNGGLASSFTPSQLSGYVNFFGSTPLISQGGASTSLSWNGNINNNGWTVRSGGNLTPLGRDSSPLFSWDSFTVMYDSDQDYSRFTLGSVSPFVGSTTSFLPGIFGVGYRRLYSDILTAFPYGRYEKRISFTKPVDLAIFINNQKRYSHSIPAGEYSFANIQGDMGYNKIVFMEAETPPPIKVFEFNLSNINYLKNMDQTGLSTKYNTQIFDLHLSKEGIFEFPSNRFGTLFMPRRFPRLASEVFFPVSRKLNLSELSLDFNFAADALKKWVRYRKRSDFYYPEIYRNAFSESLKSSFTVLPKSEFNSLSLMSLSGVAVDLDFIHFDGYVNLPTLPQTLQATSNVLVQTAEDNIIYHKIYEEEFLFDTRVLGKGLIEYGAYSGYPLSGNGSQLTSVDGLSTSLYTRLGLPSDRDLSVGVQFNQLATVGGIGVQQMSSFGLHELRVNYSTTSKNSGEQVNYVFSGYPITYDINPELTHFFSAQLQYTRSGFNRGVPLGSGVAFLAAPSYTLNFLNKGNISLGYNYYYSREFSQFFSGYALNATSILTPGLNLNLSVSQGQGFTPGGEPYVQFGVTFLEPIGGSAVYAAVDNLPSTRVSYSWSDNQLGGYGAFFDSTYQSPGVYQTSLNLRRDRAIVSWSQTQRDGFSTHTFGLNNISQRGHFSTTYTTNSIGSPQANITYGAAIAYIGGHFAVSDVITDSFIMINPSRAIANQPIMFGNFYQLDGLGPVVVNNVASYTDNLIVIDPNTIPVGVDIGKTQYMIRPRLSSGALIELGKGSGIYLVSGQFKESADKPASFVYARLYNLSDPSQEPKVVVSNKKGGFSVTGLDEGSYEFRFINFDSDPVVVSIKAPKSGNMIKLGDVFLKRTTLKGAL